MKATREYKQADGTSRTSYWHIYGKPPKNGTSKTVKSISALSNAHHLLHYFLPSLSTV